MARILNLHKALTELNKGDSPTAVHACLSVLGITGEYNGKNNVLCNYIKKYVKSDGITFYGGDFLVWLDENPHIKPKQEYQSEKVSIASYPNVWAFHILYQHHLLPELK